MLLEASSIELIMLIIIIVTYRGEDASYDAYKNNRGRFEGV